MTAIKPLIDRFKRGSIHASNFFPKYDDILDDIKTASNVIVFASPENRQIIEVILRTFIPEHISIEYTEIEKYILENNIEYSPVKPKSPINIREYPGVSEIIPNLYLTGLENVNDYVFQKYNIKHVVSVMANAPQLTINQKIIPILDTKDQHISQYFDSSYEFIENAIQNNECVLVHCYAGISRSSTIVASYIMKKFNMNSTDTVQLIKSKRHIVSPNFDFYAELYRYGEILGL
jgi:protein-tyrosine phosphatase